MTIGIDFAFETDAAGRFVFVAPDPVLGWLAAALLGQSAEFLLADQAGLSGFNPFRPISLQRRRRVWIKRVDGRSACLGFAVAPLRDLQGVPAGTRGIGVEVTEQDGRDAAIAASLRRSELIDHLLFEMRQEVLAPRMMQAMLDGLVQALGAEGSAVPELLQDETCTVQYQVGGDTTPLLDVAARLLAESESAAVTGTGRVGQPVLVCPTYTRFGERSGLPIWHEPAGGSGMRRIGCWSPRRQPLRGWWWSTSRSSARWRARRA